METNGEQVSMQIVNIVHDLTSDFKAAAEPFSQCVTDGGGRPGVKQGSKSRSTQTQPRPRLIHTLRSVLFTAPINKSNRRYKLDVHFHSYPLGDNHDRVLFAKKMLKSVTKEMKNNKNQGQQRRLA